MKEKMITLPKGKITNIKVYMKGSKKICIANFNIRTEEYSENILIASNETVLIDKIFKNKEFILKGTQVIPPERDCIFFWVKEVKECT